MDKHGGNCLGVVVVAAILVLAAAAGVINALHNAFTRSFGEGCRDAVLGLTLFALLLALLWPRRRVATPPPRHAVTLPCEAVTEFMPDPPPPPTQPSLPGATIVDGTVEHIQ